MTAPTGYRQVTITRTDRDEDGTIDAGDNCVGTPNGDQSDADDDGVGDMCDVCPAVADADQVDGVGDACSDKDADTVLDIEDNCELTPNTDQLDFDLDGAGNVCDPMPYETLTAQGDGSCSGGAGGMLGGVMMLLGLVVRRRLRA